MGFYTHRWVKAETAEQAELEALVSIKREFQFSEEAKRKAPDAKIYFEEVVELPEGFQCGPNYGATWFPMDEQ